MSLRKRTAILALMIVICLSLAAAASAGSWTLTTANGTYTGACKEGSDDSLNCHANLNSGSPENSNIIIQSGNCMLVLTPSGRANMKCK